MEHYIPKTTSQMLIESLVTGLTFTFILVGIVFLLVALISFVTKDYRDRIKALEEKLEKQSKQIRGIHKRINIEK